MCDEEAIWMDALYRILIFPIKLRGLNRTVFLSLSLFSECLEKSLSSLFFFGWAATGWEFLGVQNATHTKINDSHRHAKNDFLMCFLNRDWMMIILVLVYCGLRILCCMGWAIQRDNDAFWIMFDLIAKWELISLLFFCSFFRCFCALRKQFNLLVRMKRTTMKWCYFVARSFFPKPQNTHIYNISRNSIWKLTLVTLENAKMRAQKWWLKFLPKYWQ